jgi:hypothetical protein
MQAFNTTIRVVQVHNHMHILPHTCIVALERMLITQEKHDEMEEQAVAAEAREAEVRGPARVSTCVMGIYACVNHLQASTRHT